MVVVPPAPLLVFSYGDCLYASAWSNANQFRITQPPAACRTTAGSRPATPWPGASLVPWLFLFAHQPYQAARSGPGATGAVPAPDRGRPAGVHACRAPRVRTATRRRDPGGRKVVQPPPCHLSRRHLVTSRPSVLHSLDRPTATARAACLRSIVSRTARLCTGSQCWPAALRIGVFLVRHPGRAPWSRCRDRREKMRRTPPAPRAFCWRAKSGSANTRSPAVSSVVPVARLEARRQPAVSQRRYVPVEARAQVVDSSAPGSKL